MIGLYQGVVLAVHAYGAAQPPVRAVEGVRVVPAERDEAGSPQPVAQLAPAVDAHMAAGGVVVLLRECPVDELGVPARDGDRDHPCRAEHPGELLQHFGVVGDVLEHFGGDHFSKQASGKGSAIPSPRRRGPGRRSPQSACPRRASPRPNRWLPQCLAVGVERSDDRAPAHRLEGVAAAPAAEVEQPVARADPELVVADRQHGC